MQPFDANLSDEKKTPLVRGNFDQVHPAKLIYGFFKAGKTGVLVADDGIRKVNLYFLDGNLAIYEKGIHREKEFARYLNTHKMISTEELQSYTRLAKKERMSPVELMLEKRLLDKDLLHQTIEEFYKKNIVGLFSWRRGKYAFYEEILSDCQEQPTKTRTLRWVLEGIREKYDHVMIEKRLAKRMQTKLRLAQKTPVQISQLMRDEAEQKILQMIKDGATINTIMKESELGPTDSRSFIFGLLTIEGCKFESKGKKKKAGGKVAEDAPSDSLEKLFKMAEQGVDRIHQTYADRPSATVDVPVEEMTPEETLKHRLKAKLSKIAAKRGGAAGQAKLDEDFTDATGEDAADLGDLSDSEADTIGPYAQPDDLGDELASPDEIDAIFGEDNDVDLGDVESEDDRQAGKELKGDFDIPDSLFDETAPIEFSDEDTPENIYQLGISMVDQMMWSRARQIIQTAIDRGLSDPCAQAHLGLAIYMESSDPDRFQRAAGHVQECINQASNEPLGFLIMGKLFLKEGDFSMAEMYFVKALEIDRECTEAKEMIRKIYQER